MDPRQISFEFHSFVAGITGNGKHLRKGNLTIAMKYFESLDVRNGLVAGPIGSEPLDFDRDLSLSVVGQAECH